MQKTKIKEILISQVGTEVTVCGWVRTVRDQKSFTFVEINDGSTLRNLQIILDQMVPNLTTGASLKDLAPSDLR